VTCHLPWGSFISISYEKPLNNLSIDYLAKKSIRVFSLSNEITCVWYSITGISTPGVGPNCFLTHEYRTAIVIHLINKPIAKLLIPTRPDESAPRLAPNRLLDVYKNVLITKTSENLNRVNLIG
jgi:hypothetical protein